ncbi:NAD(P)-dependent dehydrogenase, short-chain alcohol dehydrogenase family [Verrucomicrobium sp. GAS474]|uniref:oxidoreductase n=1 Tax=Verrucomicrobium sp. GAS474 TaxID=1882831 RepID=UPI00087CD738|nr:oxidoreductase [Verrucomicrobium sp. GAS474]SDT87281.1 NAD(P)-dependent dehydrogenase, short-chain alcohol dehydrogenase family [Verrucomicrobium sp. GAS474]
MTLLSLTPQSPIGSGFHVETTSAEVIRGLDLTGKTAIVTGGYAGIGLETARTLAGAGASVIVPARDLEKAKANLRGFPGIETAFLDLLDPDSIDAFAASFLASGKPLHLLIDNAGVMAPPLTRDARGYEIQFATNHLGHFHLTARLWPALVKAEGARVVAVSSAGHRFSGVDLDDPNFERRPYDKWQAYGQSKTANALFALELDRRGRESGIRAFSLHPGAIVTDLGRHLVADDLKAFGVTLGADGSWILAPDSPFKLKTIPQGAATTVWCATSPRLNGLGGVYCQDCEIAAPSSGEGLEGMRDGVHPWAVDPGVAARLWSRSEELTGVVFPA